MSNIAVGSVYDDVIREVIKSSAPDAEEHAVSPHVLQIIKTERLSAEHRALYPWDPQPQQPPAEAAVPAATRQPKQEPKLSSAAVSSTNSVIAPRVKQEPTNLDQSFLNLPHTTNYNSALNPQYASQRAANLLHQQYGSQANASINALHQAAMNNAGNQPRQNGVSNAAKVGQAHLQQAQQVTSQSIPAQSVRLEPQVKQEPQATDLAQSQTDGSCDDAASQWSTILESRTSRGDDGPRGRHAVDGMLRRHVEEAARRMEAGGLLLPLEQRRPLPRQRQRKGTRRVRTEQKSDASLARPTGFDGPSDESPKSREDEEGDEDAINSDLDDSDDSAENGIEATFDGDKILCLYDKVQRVKNKWKCTLKDGVVTVEGKDYVFHKAQGEFEW